MSRAICHETQTICLENCRGISDIREEIAGLRYSGVSASYEYRPRPPFEPNPALSMHIEENVNKNNGSARDSAENLELQEKAGFKSLIRGRRKTGRWPDCTIDSEEGKRIP